MGTSDAADVLVIHHSPVRLALIFLGAMAFAFGFGVALGDDNQGIAFELLGILFCVAVACLAAVRLIARIPALVVDSDGITTPGGVRVFWPEIKEIETYGVCSRGIPIGRTVSLRLHDPAAIAARMSVPLRLLFWVNRGFGYPGISFSVMTAVRPRSEIVELLRSRLAKHQGR